VGAFFHALRRHTVLASVIAKIRYRQPQIINCPAILIDHRITSYRPKLRPGISPGVFAGAHGPQQRPATKFSKVDLYYSRYFLKIQTPFPRLGKGGAA